MRLPFRSRLVKWGNSLAARLRRRILETACLRERHPLNLSVGRHGMVLIQPTHRKYRLQELVSKITPRNLHAETDWGQLIGRELW